MGYLSEDPTLLAGMLLLVAGIFAIAMRATQQGKYLVRAVIAATLAAAVVMVEWLWVTDNERIEQVVYGLRDAVAESDADAALRYMTPDVRYLKGDTAMDGEATRSLIRDNLSRVRFDMVRITNLETNAAQQSRRGTATFSAFFKGTADTSMASMNIGSVNSIWSLGLQETEPGVWKVNRITPVQIPGDGLYIPGGRRQGPAMSGPGDDAIRPRMPGRMYRP
jgi:hypothetical protein